MPMTRRECRMRYAHGIRTNKNTRGLIIKGPICHSGTPAKDEDLQAQDYGRTSASAASGGINQDIFFPPASVMICFISAKHICLFLKGQDFYITALVSILEALRPNILPRAPAVEAGDATPAKPHRSISPLAPLPPDANPPLSLYLPRSRSPPPPPPL